MKRLTIGSDLQIWIDDSGKANFQSKSAKSSEAVKVELAEWVASVQRWLEAYEPPPRLQGLNADERASFEFLRGFPWERIPGTNQKKTQLAGEFVDAVQLTLWPQLNPEQAGRVRQEFLSYITAAKPKKRPTQKLPTADVS